MWKKPTRTEPTEAEERQAENDLWKFLNRQGFRESEPDSIYWQTFVARANREIDRASGGKALSISWAARVALPGAIAILFFFIGLHYYVPDPEHANISITELMLSLPAAARDSLANDLIEEWGVDHAEPDIYDHLFDPIGTEVTDYLSVRNKDLLLETLPDDQVDDLLNLLREKSKI